MAQRPRPRRRSRLMRITASVSTEALERLQEECVWRSEEDACRTPYGRILTELILTHLPSRKVQSAA